MMNLADKFKEFAAEQNKIQPVTTEDRILLFDGLNTFIRSFVAAPTMNVDGAHVGGITGFLLSLAATIRTFRPNRCIVVFDGQGGSQRRRKLFPDYKASRRTMTKLNRTYDFASLDEETRSRQWQLSVLNEILSYLPITVIVQDLVEADDVIAYLAQTIEQRGGESVIVSTDKDFLQLVNNKTKVYNPIKKRTYDETTVVADYGFHPANFLLYRTVTGDESDCIPGVSGIKEKTLLKYFPQLAEADKKDLAFLLAETANIIESKKKPPVALTELANSEKTLERNMTLMRLDDVAMSGSTRLAVLEYLDKPISPLDKYQLTKIIESHKFMNAFGRFDDWVVNSFFGLNMRAKK
jgi:5'-3' exonuclease